MAGNIRTGAGVVHAPRIKQGLEGVTDQIQSDRRNGDLGQAHVLRQDRHAIHHQLAADKRAGGGSVDGADRAVARSELRTIGAFRNT